MWMTERQLRKIKQLLAFFNNADKNEVETLW